MKSWLDIEADPNFAKLDLTEQTKVKELYFKDSIAKDPKFLGLDDEARRVVAEKFMSRAPVFENGEAYFSKATSDLVRTLTTAAPGTPAFEEAKTTGDRFLNSIYMGRDSPLAWVADVVSGAAATALGTLKDPMENVWRHGKEGEKAIAALTPVLKAAGVNTDFIATSNAVANGIADLVTNFAVTLPIGGTGALVAKGGELAIKGGLATQRIFDALASVASTSAAGGLKSFLVSRVLPNAIASTVSGAMLVGADALRAAVAHKPFETADALRSFGQGFLIDTAVWAGVDVVLPIIRASAGAYRSLGRVGKELSLEGTTLAKDIAAGKRDIKDALFDPEVFALQSERVQAGILKAQERYQRFLTDIAGTPGSAKYLKAAAGQMGFEIVEEGGKVTLTSMRASGVSRTFNSLGPEAFSWAKSQYDSVATNLKSFGLPLEDEALEKISGTVTLSRSTERPLSEIRSLRTPVAAKAIAPIAGDATTTASGLAMLQTRWNRGKPSTFTIKQVDTLTPELMVDTKILAVPKTLASSGEEARFYEYAKGRFAQDGVKMGERLDAVIRAIPFSAISPYGLKKLGEQVGSSVEEIGEQIRVDGNLMTQAEASGVLLGRAVDTGVLTERDFAILLKNSTGYSLKREKIIPGAGLGGGAETTAVDVVTIYGPGGKVIAQDSTLAELVRKRPEFSPAIPNRLVPDIVFDPSTNVVSSTTAVASGPLSSVSKLLRDYEPVGDRGPVVVSSANGAIHEMSPQRYTVRADATGAVKDFGSLAEAQKWLDAEAESFDELLSQLSKKGALSTTGDASGGIRASLDNGGEIVFKTMDDIKRFLAERPDTRSYLDLSGVPAHEMNLHMQQVAENSTGIQGQARTVFGEVQRLRESGKWKRVWAPGRGSTAATNLLFGPKHVFERILKNTGDPTFVQKLDEITNTMRAIHTADSWYAPLVERVRTGVGPSERKIVQTLLEIPQAAREKWITESGIKVTPAIRKSVEASEELYRAAGQRFGVDVFTMQTAYAPRIRRWAEMNPDAFSAAPDMLHVMKQVFGNTIPPQAQLFFKNMRKEAFIDMAREKDAFRAATYYIHAGNRATIGGKLFDELIPWANGVLAKAKGQGAVTAALQADASLRLANFISDIVGVDADYTQTVMKQLSQGIEEFGTKLLATFEKRGGVVGKLSGAALAKQTFDNRSLFRKLGSLVTFSTQSLKPMVAFRQIMQANFTSAVLGDEVGIAALKAVAENPESYIRYYGTKGILGDDIVALATSPQFSEVLLRNLKNADTIARAATAKASEMAFERGLTAMKSGRGKTMQDFFYYSGHDVLDTGDKMAIWDLFQKGNVPAARLMAAQKLVATTMFDVGKGKTGTLFRGAVGELLGKFGQYPLETVQLYRKLISNGDPRMRAMRIGRLLYNAAAVTGALGALGINAASFEVSNPLTWGGGASLDVFLTALDAKNALISPNAQNAQSSKKFWENFKLLAPTYFTKDFVQAIQFYEAGDPLRAFEKFLGFPVKPDLLKTLE